MGRNISPHYISITFAPLNFKCNYICHNLSGFDLKPFWPCAFYDVGDIKPVFKQLYVIQYSQEGSYQIFNACLIGIFDSTLILTRSVCVNIRKVSQTCLHQHSAYMASLGISHYELNELRYWQTSNISHTLVDNKIVDHSDVPVGAAPTTSSF